MEEVLSFAKEHPYVCLSVVLSAFLFLYALFGTIAKCIRDVKINKARCIRVDSALDRDYEYIELGDMVLQKHDENVKERIALPKQEKDNDKIVDFVDVLKQLKGGGSKS